MSLAQSLKELFFKDTAKKQSTGCIEEMSNLPTDDTVEGVFETVRGFKLFSAELTGVNGATPTIVTFRNELGVTPTLARTGEGVNTITFGAGGILTASQTSVIATCTTTTHDVLAVVTDTNVVTVSFFTKTGNSDTADDVAVAMIEIKVYD